MKKILLLFAFCMSFCTMPSLMAYNQNITADDYDKLWKKVEKAESKGLTQDALTAVEEIYNKAKQGNNNPQLIKAIVHIMKFKSATDVNADSSNIMRLENEIRSVEMPTKQILQSMQAELFWNYYQNNRWKILERSRLQEQVGKNFYTWDANRFMKQIFKLYLASIANRSELEKININDYLIILRRDGKESAKLRPSVYDLLAHRALDYFMTSDYDIVRPADRFQVSAEEGLGSWTNFLKVRFETPDSTSKDLHVAHIFQNLLRSHKDSISPLLDVDLKRLQWAKEHAIGEGKDTLYIKTLEGLAKTYYDNEVVAEVYANIIEYYIQRGESYNPEQGDKYKNDFYKAAGIADVMLKRFPNAPGTKRCQALKQQVLRKEVEVTAEEIGIPNQANKALLSFRNQYEWYARIVTYSPEIDKQLTEEYNPVKSAKLLAALPPVKSWEIELSPESDLRSHQAEIYIPELPSGKYWLLVSDNAAFDANEHAVAYTHYDLVSFVATKTFDSKNNRLKLYVNDRKTGLPVEGVEIDAWRAYVENPPHTKDTTDVNGVADMTMNPGEVNSYYTNYNATVKKGNESYNIIFNGYTGENLYGNGKPSHQSIYFFTDRSLYRPGQTLYFKGICMKKTGIKSEIVANQKTKIVLKDVNGQEVSSLELVSNAFGSISGTFALPSGGLTGTMTIQEEETHSVEYINVEEYKRPKFEVTINPAEGETKLGEKVTVKGSAIGFAGDAVSGANVRYRVSRQAEYPYWEMYGWWRPMPYSYPSEITNGTIKTDDKGNFSIEFTAIPDDNISKKDKPNFHYTVYADVTDITGETHSANSSVTVGYIPLIVSMNVSEKMFTDKLDTLIVSSENLNGVAQPTQGTIEIYRLDVPDKWYKSRRWSKPDAYSITESDYKRNYPNDAYKNEDDYRTWKKSSTAANIPFDTGKDKKYSLAFLQSAAQGKYVAELTTVAKSGDTIVNKVFFDLIEKGMEKPHTPTAFAMEVDKTTAQPGDSVIVYLTSSESKLAVVFDVQSNDTVLSHQYITLTGVKQRISIPVTEALRGGFSINAFAVCKNDNFVASENISVPWNNKKLNVEWGTYRNKVLPGAKEEWRIKLTGPQSEQVAAEMVAAMYDASLDELLPHNWDTDLSNFFTSNFKTISYETPAMSTSSGVVLEENWVKYVESSSAVNYDELNWFGLNGQGLGIVTQKAKMGMKDSGGGRNIAVAEKMMGSMASPAPVVTATSVMGEAATETGALMPPPPPTSGKEDEKPQDKPAVATRKNLQETAFFFPTLMTNEKGEILISFTMPESLTKWKFMSFAHTADMKSGYMQSSIQTQKELMVQPSVPRFLRIGDKVTLSAKVTNLSESDLSGGAELKITDALTGKDVTQQFLQSTSVPNFTATKGQNALLTWNLTVPEGVQAVTYQMTGRAGAFSDGEENTLPVVSNQIMVTESMPLWVKGAQTKSFTMQNLVDSEKSTTLRNQQFTLEFTSNPMWYAVQALPYLMEYPYECSEQIFARYYANALASQVANSTPRIKEVFELWKKAPASSTALVSNLEKNQELKSAILAETPWVLNAQNETERKKRVALLFDMNKMASELVTTEKKLMERQNSEGGFSWFPGMQESRYITQHIVSGIGHLKKLAVPISPAMDEAIQKSVIYIDHEVEKDFKRMKAAKEFKMDENHLGYDMIQYLYMRSFFYGVVLDDGDAYSYYFNQAKKYAVQEQNPMLKGMLALILSRGKETTLAKELLESLRQNAVRSEEMGMYWKQGGGWGWSEAPIETQALLIEAFKEIDNDTKSIEDMKVYLLKNKQTNDWKTTRATVEACNALLATNENNWETTQTPEIIVGSSVVNPAYRPDAKEEAGTGYFKTAWQASEIKPNFGQVRVSKTTEGSAWGAIYWQYFENMDKIKYASTPLSIKKELFIERNSATGPELEALKKDSVSMKSIKQGDKIVVRIEIRTDREMDYVHLKDMRAAGFEPIDVISSYQYQNGLGYYQSTKDMATNFFFESLPVGTHIFEYTLRATHKGDYSNGITTMQAMYAPEFTTHSQGVRVTIE